MKLKKEVISFPILVFIIALGFSFNVVAMPDLTITYVDSFTDQTLYVDAYLSFYVDISNIGDGFSPSSELKIEGAEFFGPDVQIIPELVQKETRSSLPLTVIFREPGKHQAVIVIDPSDKIKESNEENNQQIVNFEITARPESCQNPIETTTGLCSSVCGADRGCDNHKPNTITFCRLNEGTISEGIYKCICDADCKYSESFVKELSLSGEKCENDEECKNDKCLDGICGGEIVENKADKKKISFWQRVMDWFRSIF